MARSKTDSKAKSEVKETKEESKETVEKEDSAIEKWAAAVSKKFGKGAINLASETSYKSIPRISSGIFNLDYALGGGWPKGRVSLITGNYSSAKSRVLYGAIADAQNRSRINNRYLWEEMPEEEKAPNRAILIDAEGSATKEWMEACGIDISTLYVARPQTQEEAAEILISAVQCGEFDFIGLDSLAQLMPEEEIEETMDEASYGTKAAKNNGKMFKKVQSHLNRYQKEGGTTLPTVILINQVRDKIGAMAWGKKTTLPGGRAQEFYATIIAEFWGGSVTFMDKEKTQPKTQEYGFKIEKNKSAPPKANGSFLMALNDDPNGLFKQAQVIDHRIIYSWGEKVGVIMKDEKSGYICLGNKYERQKDLIETWVYNEKNAHVLKREIMKRLIPKQ
jgi:recombination protein RecA